jgi:hypothetical protein
MNRSGSAACRWPGFTDSSEALTMTSPVDPVLRFYDALGRGDVHGGLDIPGEDARQKHQHYPGQHLGISDLMKRSAQ